MAAVLTTSMSLRIILSVRGSLVQGGSFALSGSSHSGSSRTTHVISTRTGGVPTHVSTHNGQHTYTLDDIRTKPEGDWVDGKSSVNDIDSTDPERAPPMGVKVTIDREVDFDSSPYPHAK